MYLYSLVFLIKLINLYPILLKLFIFLSFGSIEAPPVLLKLFIFLSFGSIEAPPVNNDKHRHATLNKKSPVLKFPLNLYHIMHIELL